jgi:hypothetical protein
MKLIIAGSRTIELPEHEIASYLDDFTNLPKIKEVVCGGATGVDECGKKYAKEYCLPVLTFLADWDRHGKGAGPIRNKQMADYADALLLIWDGESKGSANMKATMEKLKKPVYEVIIKKE